MPENELYEEFLEKAVKDIDPHPGDNISRLVNVYVSACSRCRNEPPLFRSTDVIPLNQVTADLRERVHKKQKERTKFPATPGDY